MISLRRTAISYLLILIFLCLLPVFIKSYYLLHVFILTFIYIIATSSLRLIATSGQISLGHAGFMSIGAYTAAILAKELGWSPWLTLPLGGLSTMIVAMIVGYPFSRLRLIYFSMVSLFFGIGILAVNQVFDYYTGGFSGMMLIPPLLGSSKLPYYYFFLGLTLLCLIFMVRFETCRIGLTIKAIAQSHTVASSVGINEAAYRILILSIGCFFAGIAGAGYAHYTLVLTHGTFNLLASINLVIYMLVGGINRFIGPVIGTAVLMILPELFRDLKEYVPFVFSGIMLLVLFVMPDGLAGLPGQIKYWISTHRKKG